MDYGTPQLNGETGEGVMANWVSVNLNDKVRFRPTDFGRQKIAEKNAELNRFITSRGGEPLKPRWTPDSDGWCEGQLWCLMQDLGEFCVMGKPVPFETTLLIEDRRKPERV